MNAHRLSVLAISVLVLLSVGTPAIGGSGADGGATITVPGSQSIPDVQVSIENEDFTVTRVKKADPGDTIDVEVTVEVADTYRVYIYNTEDQIVDDRRGEDDATFTFDLSNYPAGTYLITVQQDGVYKAIHPLLVRGYAVSVNAPAEAAENETIDVTSETTYLRGNESEYVEVVIGNANDRLRTNLTQQADGSYAASVSLDPLPAGEYVLIADVRGPNEAYDEQEFLGISPAQTLSIGDSTSTSSGSTSGTDEPTPTPSATPSPTPGATPSPTVSPSPASTVTQSPSASPTTGPSPSPSPGVITPLPTTQVAGTSSPSPTQPGFGPLVGLIAVLLGALVVARSR